MLTLLKGCIHSSNYIGRSDARLRLQHLRKGTYINRVVATYRDDHSVGIEKFGYHHADQVAAEKLHLGCREIDAKQKRAIAVSVRRDYGMYHPNLCCGFAG